MNVPCFSQGYLGRRYQHDSRNFDGSTEYSQTRAWTFSEPDLFSTTLKYAGQKGLYASII